jgi:predicted RNA-binding protein with PUA-like domain
LVKFGRLSVMPVSKEYWDMILDMGKWENSFFFLV